jgi:hypothetical protein
MMMMVDAEEVRPRVRRCVIKEEKRRDKREMKQKN